MSVGNTLFWRLFTIPILGWVEVLCLVGIVPDCCSFIGHMYIIDTWDLRMQKT